MDIQPPETLKKPLVVPNKTLMGPGPSNCSQRVLKALSNPILGHLHPECGVIMDEIKQGIQYLFQTKNPVTMCVSASGHGGMEAALCNLLEDGDVALIGSSGHWGHRALDMAKRYGADARITEAHFGHSLTLDEIKEAFDKHKPKLFFITQGESSTGILQQNLADIGLLCRKHNCLFVVDTVASLGGSEFLMDDWKVDVAYTGSQKVLSAPPGITPISFNQRAMQKIYSRSTPVKVYYWDAVLLATYWKCFTEESRIYHHTISSTLLYGLREALSILSEEALGNSIRRHMDCSFRLQKGIESMGLEMFVSSPFNRLPTVNTIKVPEKVDWKKVSDYAMNKYSLEVSGGLGPTSGKVWRIGLMGENATFEKVDLVLKVMREAIENTSDLILTEMSKI